MDSDEQERVVAFRRGGVRRAEGEPQREAVAVQRHAHAHAPRQVDLKGVQRGAGDGGGSRAAKLFQQQHISHFNFNFLFPPQNPKAVYIQYRTRYNNISDHEPFINFPKCSNEYNIYYTFI